MVTGFNLSELQSASAKGPLIRIVIAKHAGSAPRETGTSMLVGTDWQTGTIGGGALEYEATEKARNMLAKASNTQILKVPLGPALGQCCGGTVTLVLERFTTATLPDPKTEIFARAISNATVEPLSVTRALANMRSLQDRRPLVFNDGWLIEPLQETSHPIWIYGAGHVGRAVVETLQGLSFDIIWIDTAQNRFPAEISGHATPLIAANPADVVRHAPANAQHLILTYSHALDLELCHQVLLRDFASLGVIGSATKRARFTKRLRVLGHSYAQITRMTCPIGNRALGKTPKAIAVGVVADLLSPSAVQTTRKEATL
ncbi:MAG: xanthine dehydrogenase accessory protein XdhC [Rhodobacteraceae bacterium]|nr:xanthine dehydrogenase accessory protein XdhC [Paracoccaceae bacterium]